MAPAILLLKASRASKESPTAANQGVRLPLLPMSILRGKRTAGVLAIITLRPYY